MQLILHMCFETGFDKSRKLLLRAVPQKFCNHLTNKLDRTKPLYIWLFPRITARTQFTLVHNLVWQCRKTSCKCPFCLMKRIFQISKPCHWFSNSTKIFLFWIQLQNHRQAFSNLLNFFSYLFFTISHTKKSQAFHTSLKAADMLHRMYVTFHLYPRFHFLFPIFSLTSVIKDFKQNHIVALRTQFQTQTSPLLQCLCNRKRFFQHTREKLISLDFRIFLHFLRIPSEQFLIFSLFFYFLRYISNCLQKLLR